MKVTPNPPEKFALRLFLGFALGIVLIVIFASLAKGVMQNELSQFDNTVGSYVRSFARPQLTRLNIWITTLGSAQVEIPLFLLVASYLLFKLKHTWEATLLATALAGAWLLNEVLKLAFQRSRPSMRHLVEAGGYSFPSGHAMVAAAFYGMVGYVLWLNLREKTVYAWLVFLLTGILVIAISISRVYLAVHFPSDIIAGLAAGGVWLTACITALDAIRYYKGKRINAVKEDA